MELTDDNIIISVDKQLTKEGIIVERRDNKNRKSFVKGIVEYSSPNNKRIKKGHIVLFEKHNAKKWQDGLFLIKEKNIKAIINLDK